MSDLERALDDAIRATGVERYRWLCSEANTLPAPNDRGTWRRWILAGRPVQHFEPPPRAAGAAVVAVDYGSGPPAAQPCGSC